jgi:hypothetical protein
MANAASVNQTNWRDWESHKTRARIEKHESAFGEKKHWSFGINLLGYSFAAPA